MSNQRNWASIEYSWPEMKIFVPCSVSASENGILRLEISFLVVVIILFVVSFVIHVIGVQMLFQIVVTLDRLWTDGAGVVDGVNGFDVASDFEVG